MKVLRWLALAAILVIVVAAALYLRRDSIARGIANSMLSDEDLAVTELSVESLATDRLLLSELVIESESGARYQILGLSLPLSATGTPIERITADHLMVVYDQRRDAQAMLSTTLQTVLDLPFIRPHIEATIARVSLPKLPDLKNVVWATSDQGQRLTLAIDRINIAADVARVDEQNHRMTISAVHAEGGEVLSIEVALSRDGDKINFNGQAMVHTAAWLPVVKPLELLPGGLESITAKLQGPIDILLDEKEAGHAAFNAQLTLTSELAAVYRTAGGHATNLSATSEHPLSFEFNYPSLDWIIRAEQMETVINTDELKNLPVVISGLECQSGIHCTMRTDVDADALEWQGYNFDNAKFSAPIEMEIAEVTRIEITSDAIGTFMGVRKSDFAAESVSVASFSGTQLIIDDEDWRCNVHQLVLNIDDLSAAGVVASLPITFTDLDIQDSAQTVDSEILLPPDAIASWDDMALNLPGAMGTFSINNNELTTTIELADTYDALSATLEMKLDLSTDNGSLVVNDAELFFDRARLSAFARQWTFPWDIVDGQWNVELNLQWQTVDAITKFRGTSLHKLQALAGKYNEIAFIGLNTEIAATLDSATGIDVSPSSLAVRLLDVGLPVENITAQYAVNVGTQTVQVQDLSMTVLGGEFVADPFQLSTSAETSNLIMRVKSIQLQLMVDLAEFEDIEITGAVSGVLPVTIIGDNITIEEGRLESDSPGGVIRYKADDAPLDAVVPDSGLNVVTGALNNFEFDSLTSDVNYTEAGDLKLQMRLSGINRDLDATQPIILNLGVENNVPQLLRSLQAIRSIEDILEKRTVN